MRQPQRRIRVTPQRKRKPDYRKLSAALQAYVAAQAEADAEAQRVKKQNRTKRGQRGSETRGQS